MTSTPPILKWLPIIILGAGAIGGFVQLQSAVADNSYRIAKNAHGIEKVSNTADNILIRLNGIHTTLEILVDSLKRRELIQFDSAPVDTHGGNPPSFNL